MRAAGAERGLERCMRPPGSTLDSAGEAAARVAVAGVLHDPLGTQPMERLSFDLLFRWFVGLASTMVWNHSVLPPGNWRPSV